MSTRANVRLIGLMSCILALPWMTSHAQTTSLPSQVEGMVRQWAPLVFQQTYPPGSGRTSFEVNQIVAVDFDGTVDPRDNVAHARALQSNYNREATVYYSAVETGDDYGHGLFFLSYYFYHVRDAGAPPIDGGHQNDMEGVEFIVRKSVYSPRGYLVASLTQAHGGFIPWMPRAFGNPGGPPGAAKGYQGYQYFLGDYNANGYQRPLIVSAGGTHGVYAPQECGPETGVYEPYREAKGIDYGATTVNSVSWCGGGGILWYHPELAPVYGGSVANGNEEVGSMFYRLVELYPSVIWQNRLFEPLFKGSSNVLLMVGGLRGREEFNAEGNGDSANPPWAWQGKAIGPGGFYWNTWSEDGGNFPLYLGGSTSRSVRSALTGAFVTAPDQDAALRFSGIPDLNFPTRYNPYVSNPPDYSIGESNMVANGSLPPGDIAVIHGPSQVRTGTNCYWYASTSVTSPTFFAWSIDGNIIGSSADLWYAAPAGTTFELTFQVFDDYGHGASTSISVTASDDGPMCYVE